MQRTYPIGQQEIEKITLGVAKGDGTSLGFEGYDKKKVFLIEYFHYRSKFHGAVCVTVSTEAGVD